jgi:hypothetical protein
VQEGNDAMTNTGGTGRYRWWADVVVEGGPIIVADVSAYPRWRGVQAEPATEPLVVSFYGPIVAELPARFQPSGVDEWHQVARLPDLDAARDYVAGLRAAAEAVEPGLTLHEQRAMTPEELAVKAKAALAAQDVPFV